MITRRALLTGAAATLLPGGTPMGFQNPITGGQGALIRPAVKSPNYTPGVSGWTINRNGSAEFNNVTVRGTVIASTFEGTDFFIDSDGAFFYSGTPAAGNLIASIAHATGADAFGNQYVAGIGTYDYTGAVFTQLDNGLIKLGQIAAGTPDTADAAVITQEAALALELKSFNGQTATSNDPAVVELIPGGQNKPQGSAQAPITVVRDSAGNSPASLWVTGPVLHADSLTGQAATTWLTVAGGGIVLGTGWADNLVAGGAQGFQVRIDAEDNLILTGTLHTISATPAATIFTLAGKYVPKTLQRDVQVLSRVGGVNTTNILSISASTGNVSLVANLTTNTTDLYINASVPLGNIA